MQKRPAQAQQPNVHLEPKWLRCCYVSSNSEGTSPSRRAAASKEEAPRKGKWAAGRIKEKERVKKVWACSPLGGGSLELLATAQRHQAESSQSVEAYRIPLHN